MTITRHLLPVAQDMLPLTIARGTGSGAALVIMPSAFGVAADLETQMEELAQYASLVVAFDPFFRGDAGPVPYDDMKRVMARLQVLDRKQTYQDLRAAIDWARTQTSHPALVMLGVCFGAPFAMLAAADGAVDAIATWHGSRMENYLERASEMRCPMRLHFGGADPVAPMSAVEQVRSALAQRTDVQIAVYDNVGHGFSHPAAPAYDQHAERAAMKSVCELVQSA